MDVLQNPEFAEWLLGQIQNDFKMRNPDELFPNGEGWRAIPTSVEELMSLEEDARAYYIDMLEDWWFDIDAGNFPPRPHNGWTQRIRRISAA